VTKTADTMRDGDNVEIEQDKRVKGAHGDQKGNENQQKRKKNMDYLVSRRIPADAAETFSSVLKKEVRMRVIVGPSKAEKSTTK